MSPDRAEGGDPADATPTPDPLAEPLSMVALYRQLPPEARAEYDEALREVLHTLDRLPRDGLPQWVTELHHDLDREDIAIRRIKREEE